MADATVNGTTREWFRDLVSAKHCRRRQRSYGLYWISPCVFGLSI